MDVLIFLASLVLLAICASGLIHFKKKVSRKKLKDYDFLIGLLSIISLSFSIVLFFSSMSQNFSTSNFVLAISSFTVIQATILIVIFSKLQKNKNIVYSTSFLLISIIPAIINNSLAHLSIPVSFLVLLMTFLSFAEDHNSHIPTLIAYSSISLFMYIISIINKTLIPLLTVISFSLFLVFFIEFLKFLQTSKEVYIPKNKKSSSPLVPFLKHLIFIIIITNFVFIGTVGIHELGHSVAAQFSSCEDATIVYEMGEFPHTEMTCSDLSNKNELILAGILSPLAIAILLAFAGGKSIKEISLEMIGIDLGISYSDYMALGLSNIFSLTVSTLGIIIASVGLILLIKSRTN